MRKAKTDPSFEYYLRASCIDEQALVLVLKGHLVIEAILVELIQIKVSNDTPWKWNFPAKTSQCVHCGFINQAQADALNDLNDLRNDCAHILGQQFTFDRIFTLIKKAADAGFDFSDETIHRDPTLSEEWYGIEAGLSEVLNSFYFDLADILHASGGPDRRGG